MQICKNPTWAGLETWGGQGAYVGRELGSTVFTSIPPSLSPNLQGGGAACRVRWCVVHSRAGARVLESVDLHLQTLCLQDPWWTALTPALRGYVQLPGCVAPHMSVASTRVCPVAATRSATISPCCPGNQLAGRNSDDGRACSRSYPVTCSSHGSRVERRAYGARHAFECRVHKSASSSLASTWRNLARAFSIVAASGRPDRHVSPSSGWPARDDKQQAEAVGAFKS